MSVLSMKFSWFSIISSMTTLFGHNIYVEKNPSYSYFISCHIYYMVYLCSLGLKSLTLMNQALLSKLNQRYTTEVLALWIKINCKKYGFDNQGWSIKEVKGSRCISSWKSIGGSGTR